MFLRKPYLTSNVYNAGGYDWYVDSLYGDDTYNGKSPAQAFQSIGKVSSVLLAGQSVGLAKNSYWREELILLNNCKVESYGSGARPILDASNITSGWSKTVGQTNVYELSITPEWSGSGEWLTAFEDDVYLARVADVATCDSTPGSYYPSGASGTITLYIHASDSGNPNTNLKVYEYSHRASGISGFSVENCRIVGVVGQKCLGTKGNIVLGRYSVAIDCLSKLGNSHNYLMKGGSKFISCIAQEGYYTIQDPVLFVAYETDPENLDISFIDCLAQNASLSADNVGFAFHTDGVKKFGTVLLSGCEAINCFNAFTGDDSAQINLHGVISTNCTKSVITQNPLSWSIDGLRVTGECTRIIEMQPSAGTILIANNIDADIDCVDTRCFYMLANHTLTLTNSIIRATTFSGTSRHFYISQAGAVLNCSGNTYGDGFAHIYYCPNIASITSDNNCFDDNNEAFRINAISYTTVNGYQTGTSQDLNSTIGGCDL